jgi:hypothetical protein
MSSTPRIPKAEMTGLFGYVVKKYSRKLLGDVPEPAEVMWHNRPVLTIPNLGAAATVVSIVSLIGLLIESRR